MCGICGFIDTKALAGESDLARMTATLPHRGPDDQGIWFDSEHGIGLGHTRLSILDLSPLGHQPMHSACGRYAITYNGEVYNHLSLRNELSGYDFRSTSDTETILAAIREWGLEQAVKRFVGMFAFAVWDRQERRLHLVRDRVGIKPLYYGNISGAVVFGSELKALRAFPGFNNELDRDALCAYFRHCYIPAPSSIYKDVYKLQPGTIATFAEGATAPSITTYWSARDVWANGGCHPFQGDIEMATEALEGLLDDAVSLRMLSDVPLGAFLSGGIDSSTIVALMQKRSTRPIKTFSIGFHESRFNEADHAREVARHLGTDHTELYLTPQDLLDVIPLIPRHWDEPFADSSQIPTYCISRLAREQVTVCLSGDGGDELFAGYSRYFMMDKWGLVEKVPLPFRRMAAALVPHLPAALFSLFGRLGPHLRWRADAVSMTDFSEFYRSLISQFRHPQELVLGAKEAGSQLTDPDNRLSLDRFGLMTFWDTVSYLPDDILTKVDRASMAVALESRVPLLDHRVIEFAASLPTQLKVEGKTGKTVLRKVLHKYVPAELVERPKMGFGVPIEQWMANELRDWCEALLDKTTMQRQGILNTEKVQQLWQDYLNGDYFFCHHLWNILMFQSWLEENHP
ncbi:asparagine synthase (glutamine-hydrolyzing) [Pseudodesulfovibrio sp.]|uniref:asparagine synthase (glutamine-hydrolyzing) n=1 Tax=unclassified Pseudodesulfovibrio TaxID=2661612 RepID=UPI003B00DA22